MLGMRVAGAYPAPKRWVYRLFGYLNIHDRQRWAILWPKIREIRSGNLRILDAGCGSGSWVLELASRIPQAAVVGIDRNAELIQKAERRRAILGIENARFVAADCLSYRADARFDLVLSLNAAHYSLPTGKGLELFQRFREWLAPESGVLLLMAPRCARGLVDESAGNPAHWPGFVSIGQAATLCRHAGLEVRTLAPRIGRFGILAKRLALMSERTPPLSAMLYPAQLAFSLIDRQLPAAFEDSAVLLLVATRPGQRGPDEAPDGSATDRDGWTANGRLELPSRNMATPSR